jgi:hypothetical protein|eukprot:COSAG01_NODE_870_length_13032_cov_8.365654_1_plen_59_part_00
MRYVAAARTAQPRTHFVALVLSAPLPVGLIAPLLPLDTPLLRQPLPIADTGNGTWPGD